MAAQLKTELTLKDKNFSAQLNSACRKAQASLAQVSNTTKGFGNILGGLGGQLGKTVTGLSGMAGAFTSLVNPVTAVGAAVGLAGKAFFDYNKKLEETQRLTKQFTGLDGNQLSSLTNGIQAVADSTGHEFREVLSSVDAMMKQFGINGETALKIIQDGFVAGADDSGQFLDMLKQYQGSFNDIGVSADELTAIIAQTRSGIFNEEGMAAIQMAGKNIRNMSKSTKESLAAIGISADQMIAKLNNGSMTTMQAIQQISGALKKVPAQAQETGAVLQDVFGKKGAKAGYELVTSLADMSTNLDEVKQRTGEQGQVQEELINTTREWNNACESLFAVAGGGFADMGKKMKIYVLQNLTKIINKFIDLYNKSTVVRAVIASWATSFKMAWDVIKAVFRQIGIAIEGIADAFEHLISGEFGKVGGDIKKTIQASAANITATGKEMGQDLLDGFNQGLHGHIDKVHTEDIVEEDYGKSTGKGTGGGKSTGKSSGGKSGKGNKNKNKTIEAEEGSLKWLEDKLAEIKEKYAKGVFKWTPEKYAEEVKKWEDKIEKKKIEMYPELDPEGLPMLKKQLQQYKEDLEKGKIKVSTEEARKTIKDLEDKIEAKEFELGLKLPPNEIEQIEKEIKQLDENQLNPKLRIDPEEYKRIKKEKEAALASKKVEIGVSLDKDELDKEYKQLKEDFGKKSSFEMAVQPEAPKSGDDKLSYIQDQMDKNDELIERLKELQKAYSELGEAGKEKYDEVTEAINRTVEANQKLAESGQAQDAANKKTQKTVSTINDAASAVGSLGDSFSSLGSAFESPELNVAGTIAQAIAQIALGASTAIAQFAETGNPFVWVAMSLATMAQLAAMISQLHSITGMASGGIVGGGKSVGDKNLVRLNSGELVLNQTQQGRLWRMINGSESLGVSSQTNGQVEFKIRGADLYGSLKNYKTLTKK